MTFKVPDEDRKSLGELATLSSSGTISQLISALRSATPALWLSELIERVGPVEGLERRQVAKFVRLLATMYGVRTRSGLSVGDFVDQLLDVIREESGTQPSPESDARFRDILAQVLTIEPLFVTAKALDVFAENDHLMCEPRVTTDLRPIFGMNDSPNAAVAVHTLRIAYHKGGAGRQVDAVNNFFVVLDSSDIRQLRDALDRALLKEKELSAIATASQLQWLSHYHEGDDDAS